MTCPICNDVIGGAVFECWDCDRDVCENCVNLSGLCDDCNASFEPDDEEY